MVSKQLERGTKIEMQEHGLSKKIASKIASDHIRLNKNAYKKKKKR